MPDGLRPFIRATLGGPAALWSLPFFVLAPLTPQPGAAAVGASLLYLSTLAHEGGHILAAKRQGRSVVLGADRVGPRVRVVGGSTPGIARAGVKAGLFFTIPGAVLALPWLHPLLAVLLGVGFALPGAYLDLQQARILAKKPL